MGIVESVCRFLGRKKEDDQENGDSSRSSSGVVELPKICRFHSRIYGAIKGLVQKALFILHRILPIQNNKSPTVAESAYADQESQSTGQDTTTLHHVVSSQQWPPETAKPDTGKETVRGHVTISIPADARAEENINNEIINNDLSSSSETRTPPVIVKRTVAVDDEERRFKHYSSRHRILLVGEGDFSFSASLAVAFGSASNIIATSLDSKAFLKKHYGNATSNMEKLRSMGAKVMHGIDATQMAHHPSLRTLKFDRIIFNFPFAGFFRNLSPDSQLRRHRRLVSLFLKNAREMVSEDGEIHITHKTNGNYVEWKVESIASSHGLKLIQAVKFKHLQYPGYNPKYGFGGDGNFNCYPCKTYKFGLKDKPAL